MKRRLIQVDVFGESPFLGNPLAVVLDADGIDDAAMATISRWTNLSETTFVVPPTSDAADYRVRIWTPFGELPFAGHPTLGTCWAWRSNGGVPKQPNETVQECGAGLITVRDDGDRLAFAAPPLVRGGPVDADLVAEVIDAMGLDPSDVEDSQWVDNGPGWMALLLRSADAVRAVRPRRVPVKVGLAGLVGLVGPELDRDAGRRRGARVLPQGRHARRRPGDRQPQRLARPVADRVGPPQLAVRRLPGFRPRSGRARVRQPATPTGRSGSPAAPAR